MGSLSSWVGGRRVPPLLPAEYVEYLAGVRQLQEYVQGTARRTLVQFAVPAQVGDESAFGPLWRALWFSGITDPPRRGHWVFARWVHAPGQPGWVHGVEFEWEPKPRRALAGYLLVGVCLGVAAHWTLTVG